MKITDTSISKFFNLPYQTISDWKKADKNNWRYKIYSFLKKNIEVGYIVNNGNHVSNKTVTMATRIYALNNLFQELEKDEVAEMKAVFDGAQAFDYNHFDEDVFEIYKMKLVHEISMMSVIKSKSKNKIIKFVSELNINGYIITWDFFNNCVKEIK